MGLFGPRSYRPSGRCYRYGLLTSFKDQVTSQRASLLTSLLCRALAAECCSPCPSPCCSHQGGALQAMFLLKDGASQLPGQACPGLFLGRCTAGVDARRFLATRHMLRLHTVEQRLAVVPSQQHPWVALSGVPPAAPKRLL